MPYKGFSPFLSVLAGYQISDQEVGATSYYGYLDRDENWYIMKAVRNGAITNYTYVKGAFGYSANWANRTNLVYQTFSEVF